MLKISDRVLSWKPEDLLLESGWIRYVLQDTSDKEKKYYISYSDENFPLISSDKELDELIREKPNNGFICRNRFLCKYSEKKYKDVSKYILKIQNSDFLKKEVDLNREILNKIFNGKKPIGYFHCFFRKIIKYIRNVITWVVLVFLQGTFWLIIGSILRPYMAFNEKYKLQNKLKDLKSDYNFKKMIERLGKQENADNCLDNQIQIIEKRITDVQDEIHDSTNNTIALLLAIISIIISIA